MKKMILLVMIITLLSGCGKKETNKNEEKVAATGELVCAYKENRTSENTLYTSLYRFNYNDKGILEEVIDTEIIELDDATDEIKEKYQKSAKETTDEYKDIDGVKASLEEEENKYTIKITLDVAKLTDELKEKYMVNYDRVNTHKIFTDLNYTCE